MSKSKLPSLSKKNDDDKVNKKRFFLAKFLGNGFIYFKLQSGSDTSLDKYYHDDELLSSSSTSPTSKSSREKGK